MFHANVPSFPTFNIQVCNTLCNVPLLFENSAEQHLDKYAAFTSMCFHFHKEDYNHYMTYFSSEKRRIFSVLTYLWKYLCENSPPLCITQTKL